MKFKVGERYVVHGSTQGMLVIAHYKQEETRWKNQLKNSWIL